MEKDDEPVTKQSSTSKGRITYRSLSSQKAPRPIVTKPQPLNKSLVDQEIDQLRRRYQIHGFKEEILPYERVLTLQMPIEDPEFPFDLDAIHLRLVIPPTYPSKEGRPSLQVLNKDIPEAVKRRIRNRMDEAAEKMLLPNTPYIKEWLRELDRNLEKWMVALPTIESSNVKGTGIKFISPSEIKVSAPSATPLKSNETQLAKSLEILQLGIPIKKEASQQTRFHPPQHIKLEPEGNQAGAIEMSLSKLELLNIGLLIPLQVEIIFSCNRCKAHTFVNDLRPDVDRIIPCAGCKQYLEVRYTRLPLHQFNQKLGYIRFKRAYPTDLTGCSLQVTCDTCTPTDPLASSIRIDRVRIGEHLSFPCRHCHRTCSLTLEGPIVWNILPGPTITSGSDTKVKGLANTKTGAITASKLPSKVGEPLPDYGTCSHYRKSHRWFRFPCCARAFPCDDCHRQDLSSRDHEPEWATRQICGFCSREFGISQRYCECGEEPAVASTRHTAHWEGGKGTRDQSTMSKKDCKKYRNQEKTISSKARSSRNPKKK